MNSRIKVLFVIDHFRDPHAGTEGQLFQLIAHLDRSLFEPHLLLFSESAYVKKEGFPCPYTVLGHTRLASPITWLALLKRALHFRRQGFRLAHIFFNDPSVICPPVFFLVGIKTLISRRDMGYWYTPIVTGILRLTGKFVTGALTNSNAVAELTSRTEHIPAGRVRVIYNGYLSESDSTELQPVPELLELKNKGAVIVGLVANIRPIKRIGDLIDAVALVMDNCPHLHIVIIGGGDSISLQSQAAKVGLPGRVHFLGARPDVRACLAYFDMAALCSESEGFSNAIIEYMQAGLPVICTATGGNPEAVANGETGYLYPVGEVSALANWLELLYKDDEKRRKMGTLAKERAERAYSVNNMVQAHQRIYTQSSERRIAYDG